MAAANHYLMNSIFANSTSHERAGGQVIAVHPDDASARRLISGLMVRVHNDRGAFIAQLAISTNTRPGVATMDQRAMAETLRRLDDQRHHAGRGVT